MNAIGTASILLAGAADAVGLTTAFMARKRFAERLDASKA